MRIRLIALAAVLLVGACGRVTQAGPATGYRLYEAVASGSGPAVALIDTRSRASYARLPLGAPSAGWTHYYSVGGRSLLDIDPETGATQSRVGLPGDYQLPPATNSGIPGGLSQNGAWLVLQRFDGASHFLVYDTAFTDAPRRIDLAGRFMFDAISNDGDRVYLIQYIAGGDYHVRAYSMSAGALDPQFVVDKNEGGNAMNGLKLTGVASADGQWLFSVYARAHGGAFIHALNLESTFAFCLDLPGTGYAAGSNASLDWSLALSPDGTKVYATNAAMGIVTEILAGNPSIGRTVDVGGPSPVWPAGAAVSADGKTLVIAGPTGIEWLDTSTLKVKRHALDTWTVRSLALSPDGRTLYAVDDRGKVAEVSMTSGAVTTTFDPNVAHPIALMRVEPVSA